MNVFLIKHNNKIIGHLRTLLEYSEYIRKIRNYRTPNADKL